MQKKHKPNNAVDVKLSVAVEAQSVTATLTFTNQSSADVHIEKINGCLDGSIQNDVFKITADGERVLYTGALAKRFPPGPEDFVKVAPGKKLTTTVRLDQAYGLIPGSHRYRAAYSALHPFPDRPGFLSLESNSVSFTVTPSPSTVP
jgi:hypothetical protein